MYWRQAQGNFGARGEHVRTHEPRAIRAVPFLAAFVHFSLNWERRPAHIRPQREPWRARTHQPLPRQPLYVISDKESDQNKSAPAIASDKLAFCLTTATNRRLHIHAPRLRDFISEPLIQMQKHHT